jgi:hypothetical protein
MRSRLMATAASLSATKFILRRDVVERFINDYEKLVLGDQLPYKWRQAIRNQFARGGGTALQSFLKDSVHMLNQVGQRTRGKIYAEQLVDYLPRRSWGNCLGSLISTVQLSFQNHRTFVFVDGFLARFRAIRGSTPYADYSQQEKQH